MAVGCLHVQARSGSAHTHRHHHQPLHTCWLPPLHTEVGGRHNVGAETWVVLHSPQVLQLETASRRLAGFNKRCTPTFQLQHNLSEECRVLGLAKRAE